MLRITEFQNRNEEWFTPGMFMVGTHHAREHLSTEIPLMMARYLLENYGKDADITRLIEYRDIYIAPLLNVDGMLHDIEGRDYKMWRKNRRVNKGSRHVGVDLNRNYSFGWEQVVLQKILLQMFIWDRLHSLNRKLKL